MLALAGNDPQIAFVVPPFTGPTQIKVQVPDRQLRPGLGKCLRNCWLLRHLRQSDRKGHGYFALAPDGMGRLYHHASSTRSIYPATSAALQKCIKPIIPQKVMISYATRTSKHEISGTCKRAALLIVTTKGPLTRTLLS